MSADDLIDKFAGFCARILYGVEHEERAARKYQFLLEKINELLLKTHGIVVERLEKVEMATRPAEAESALAELRSEALEESFRLKGYCDVFEAYGRTLDELAWKSETQNDSVASDLGAIREFAVMLMDREREVAIMYTDEIEAMAGLGDFEGDLPSIKRRAATARAALTEQMADFAAKVERFESASK